MASKHRIRWVLGHKNLDYFEEAAESFKKAVESGSGGALEVRISTIDEDVGSAPDAGAAQIAAKVARGEAEMGHSFADVMGFVDPRIHVFETPFLFRGYRHMEGVLEGPIGTGLLEGLRERGLVGLSFTYSGGANGVASLDVPLRSPEDLRGLKVGVYGDRVNEAWLSSLGASAVAIEHRLEGLLRMAREGSLDAAVITWRNFEQAQLHNDFRHFCLHGSTYLASVSYANAKFFDALPPELQALLRAASNEAARIERAKTIELNDESMRLMLPKGVRAVHLPPDARAAFDRALRPAYEGIRAWLGGGFLDEVRKTPDVDVHPSVPAALAAL